MAKNLWKFERRERQAEGSRQPSETAQSASDAPSVGTELRECREARGEDLRYVAQMLRIRYPYLKAIEEGLVDDLPGPTYAVGFVRTYAEHLGLDAKDLVVRFKAEVEGLHSRSDLNFPAPIPEGKIPSGAIILVGIVVAALVYAVWIYASSNDKAVSEMAAPSPSSASSVADGGTDTVASSVAGAGQSAPAQDGSEAASDPGQKAATGAADKPADAPAPEKSTVATAGSESDGGAKTEPSTAPVAESQKTPEPAKNPEQTKDKDKKATAPPPPPDATANADAQSGDPVAVANAEPAATRTERGKVYGQENTGARIVLHAIADSWVEVRDKATDELLLTRVLFKGDSFRVPNRSGLSLLTGNAGGLRITVDDKEVSPIGAIGSVRRDVPLEPDRLTSSGGRDRNPNQSATTSVSGSSGQ
jgi:cytoskeleton protein RodZ